MFLIITLVLILTTLATLYLYFFGPHNEAQLKIELSRRNVLYIKQPNAFFQAVRRERADLENRNEQIKQVGRIFGFKNLGSIIICVADPEIAQIVLSSEFTNFTNRRILSLGDDLFFTKNIASAQGEHWKRLRSVITPTFSSGSLRSYKTCLDDTVRTLLANIEKSRLQSEDLNLKMLYGTYTMDSNVQVAFGLKIDSLAEKDHPVIVNAHRLFSNDFNFKNLMVVVTLLMAPKLAKLLGIRFNRESIDFFTEFATKILIDKRAAYTKDSTKKANNFLELMLKAEVDLQNNNEDEKVKFMTNEEIIVQCSGYDTTASAIALAVYQLASHLQVQQKLYEEILQVLAKLEEEVLPGSSHDPVDLISIDSLSQFQYLNAVLNESLRLYPPATFTERQASKDMVMQTVDVRVEVKQGDVLHFPIYSMHRDPKQFPEPDAFKPERFLTNTFHKYSFLPFGQGPRNCIAKPFALIEMKLALLHTVRLYKVSLSKQTTVPPEFFFQGNTLIPKNIILKLEKKITKLLMNNKVKMSIIFEYCN